MWYKRYWVWLLLCLCGIGAETITLDEHSSGQLVCSRSLGIGSPCVMIFRGIGSQPEKWVCEDLMDGKRQECNAVSYRVLPMTEHIQPWELSTYCVNMLKKKETPANEAVADLLLEWRGGARGGVVRRFLVQEKKFMTSIAFHLRKCYSPRKTERDLAIDEIRDRLQSCSVLDELNKLIDQGDFYAAVTMVSRMKMQVMPPLEKQPMKSYVSDVFDGWETAILNAYIKSSDQLQARYQAYNALFPKSMNVTFRAPVSFAELTQKCTRSYAGYKITRKKSSFCDFEEWGAGMLDVLQTLPGNSEAAVHFGKEFDKALTRYQEYLKKAGK